MASATGDGLATLFSRLGSRPSRITSYNVCYTKLLRYPVGALVQDGYAEAVMKALVKLGATFDRHAEPDWQQNLMWAANQALCGVIGVGVPQDWATHRIAVELVITSYSIHYTKLYDANPARHAGRKSRPA